MEWIMFAVAGAVTGLCVWLGVKVRRLRRLLRASVESQQDTVVLWTQDRERLREELRRMEVRAIDALVGEDVARSSARLVREHLVRVCRERDEARAASRLALTYYGRELESREAAEAAADEAYGRLEVAA